jgi:hypothetical protein
MAWLRALMTATGWLASLAKLRDQRIGDAPWLGTGYGTLPEVFRNTARSTIAAAGSDLPRGYIRAGVIRYDHYVVLQLDQLCPAAEVSP